MTEQKENFPKNFLTFRDFCLELWHRYQNGIKTYRGLSIEWAINYAKKYKKKEIKTILNQLNINGNTDKIVIVGNK